MRITRELIIHAMTMAFIYSLAAIITVKTNDFLTIKKDECTKDIKSHYYCNLFINPIIQNTFPFIVTFISTFILYIVVNALFKIKY